MYISTRGFKKVKASEAIIKGLAPDGGLFIPEALNKLNIDESFINLSYKELAKKLFKEFLDDFSLDEISNIIDAAYSRDNFNGDVAEVKEFNDIAFMSLYQGPTFAFKDVALTILPLLMEKALEKNNNNKKTFILTATSGDTGSAAMSGFSRSNIKTIVLYPNGGVSRLQEAQMHSFDKDKATALALDGNFDDCQRTVKKAFLDIKDENINLASANSINIGRLIPQIVYYFYAYFSLVRSKRIKYGEAVNFSVPTGNFGNILACFYAKRMGLFIDKIICASNKNNVLTDFIASSIYNKNRTFYKTISPSMDILVSSNLERYLYYLNNEDASLVSNLMDKLNKEGKYEVDKKIEDFIGGYLTEEETCDSIKDAYDNYHHLIDPHTAVAYGVAKKLNIKGYTVIASTASPFKFINVYSEMFNLKEKDDFSKIKELAKKTNTKVDNRILALENIRIDKEVVKQEDCIKKIKELIGVK